MKIPAFLFASILPLAATPENPLIPETWFHELAATDGSTQQCIIFTTVPGVEYTFFHSNDLGEWAEVGKTYGFGQEFAAAMRETAPAPPPPDPENPPAESPILSHASINIQPSSGTAGGTVVSWPSLDHGYAMRTLIAGSMSADWQTVPLFAASHGSHQFFIIASDSGLPPEENPQLGALDTAMIADLEVGWADFNTAVTTSAETARNTPPPPPPAVDAKGFWRIKADWSLDSDNDGSFDHLEFALAAQAPGADGLAGNAFNADTNGDTIPDGEQLDKDGDSIPDAQDIEPGDGGVAYANVALPRYAMFTFADTPDGSFAINDRGTVLFPGKVWKAGGFQNLITDQSQIPDYPEYYDGDPLIHARAINDNDLIIGSGHGFQENHAPGLEIPYFSPILHWPSPGAIPQVVSLVAGSATTYAALWDQHYVTHLDNAGGFFSSSLIWDTMRQNPGPDDGGWRKWTLPAGANPLSSVAAEEHSKATATGGIVWGSEYDFSTGLWAGSWITAPVPDEIPIDPGDILVQGGNGNLVATGSFTNGFTRVRRDGVWLVSPMLANARDLADNGTAIGTPGAGDLSPSILLNGKWTPLARAVPVIPDRWKTSPAAWLSDISPGGWILAHDHPGGTNPDDLTAALLPLRFKGQYTDSSQNLVDEAVGVDDFSIGSSDPDLHPENATPVEDRIWVMAPLGGAAKSVVLGAPLHATAPVTISADGILFGGQEEAVCDSTETILSVTGAPGSTTGEEKLMTISMGTSESASKPVGFKVMKSRTVNVTVYKVGETRITQEGSTQLEADLVPEKTVLENFLNDVFKPQVNVSFVVDIKPIQVNSPLDYEPDGIITGGDENLSADQIYVRLDAYDQAGEPAADTSIEVYLLGTHKLINATALGTTHPGTRTCWVKAKVENSARIEEELAQLMNTISHEIGHVMIGEGHPGAEIFQGPAPLPGTRHSMRLMRHGNNNPKGFDHLLVKAEWDKIESWLQIEETEERID